MNRERRFGRLGRSVYEALVDGTALCQAREHQFVELDHWLWCLWQRPHSDLQRLLVWMGADGSAFSHRLEKSLSLLPTCPGGLRDLSGTLEHTVAGALGWSQLVAGANHVRSGHLLLAGLEDPTVRRWLEGLVPELKGHTLEALAAGYEAEASAWKEAQDLPTDGRLAMPLSGSQPATGGTTGQSDGLARWATSLSEQAQAGELDPVVGRDQELRQVIDVLLRRRQNNPILVGEAGVGKTAIAEALAQRVQQGQVPPALANARVWALDLGRMQAGASARGEFEQRLRSLLDTVIAAPHPIILFCDEVHTLVGAGGAQGTGDAANLIKPMLARGQLRMIAATTWSEYKQFIEPDAALTRRFQSIAVDEPTDDVALAMLRVVGERFATHHGVRIADSALQAAVQLSRRHLPGRQLPDKAISLLDTACARVAMSHSAQPAEMDAMTQELLELEQALAWRSADQAMGLPVGDTHALTDRKELLLGQIQTVSATLAAQRRQVGDMLRAIAAREPVDPLHPSYRDIYDAMSPDSDGTLWVRPWVDQKVIADVLSEWTGVPGEHLATDDAQRLSQLEHRLQSRIHGQRGALQQIAGALQVARAGLNDPHRPLGVFMLAGPTGTGKSETAAVLADLLFGGLEHVIQFNMNEFQESHSVSTLKGAPPGYVGYGKGGRLTEAVRRRPYSVILLDEFDRAHRDVHDVFYQVFDRGWMEDGEGRRVSFRNCLILLTTNLGAEQIEAACEAEPAAAAMTLHGVAHRAVAEHFSAPLLARLQVIAYRPLGHESLALIADGAIGSIRQNLEQGGVALEVDPSLREWVARTAAQHPAKGRAARDLLRQTVVPVIARGLFKARSVHRQALTVRLSAIDGLGVEFEPPLEEAGVAGAVHEEGATTGQDLEGAGTSTPPTAIDSGEAQHAAD